MILTSYALKTLYIYATIMAMIMPFALEFYTFRRDKKKKITYKRLRLVIYTAIYIVLITSVLRVFKEWVLWIESFSFVQWLANNIAVSSRVIYFAKVFVAVLVNFAIGMLYRLFSKFVRIGLKRKNLTTPKKKNGEFTWRQKTERKVISYFYTETWFFVGDILRKISISLTAIYAILFFVYQLLAVYKASWIPYGFVSMVFGSGYTYPTITLLALWETVFFLDGIKRIEEECPEFLNEDNSTKEKNENLLDAIDEEVRKKFKDFYVCDVNLSKSLQEEVVSAQHNEITKIIATAVENDERISHHKKEVYLNCLDKLIESKESVLINGAFFSEFSLYFFRYLSVIIARGDNVAFICNNNTQIREVHKYVKEGFSKLSSLYCDGELKNSLDFDDPVWRIVSIDDETIDDTAIDDASIVITSVNYLCSSRFESEHSKFIYLLDSIVFVDTLKTVNMYTHQLSMLNTRIKQIAGNNAFLSQNGNSNNEFRVRFRAKEVKYICFDNTRTSGLDKVLKNQLMTSFQSVDATHYGRKTMVRCYNYEGKVDELGRRSSPQFFNSDEEIGVLLNMALLCLAKGASSVTVFAEDLIPYANIEETLSANMSQVVVDTDGKSIRLNTPFYDSNDYSVMIIMDSGDNLPAAIRKYASMVSDKPVLIIIFSRPYLMRDYYSDRINEIWSSRQEERIPVEEGTKKDIAQRILVKANAGGISEEEIIKLASGIPQFAPFVQAGDVNAILRAILEIYGLFQKDKIDVYQYFEYSSLQDFDENGVYRSENRVLLRRKGKLFDMINGRDMLVMSTHDRDITLSLPKVRLTQNYIAGQNLLYNGNIYYINKVDTVSGHIYSRLAVGGKNNEVYQYIQDRKYYVELNPEKTEEIFPTKHVIMGRSEKDVTVKDIFISVFRAPMEVVTEGYYEIDPHTLTINAGECSYHSINDYENDDLAKQTYRRYGDFGKPTYSSDTILKSTDLVAFEKGALMMSIRINGQLGHNVDKLMLLAAIMLNETLHAAFPSVSDSIVVCPVLHEKIESPEVDIVARKQPSLTIVGERESTNSDFELMIIEDCVADLGVVSVLMTAGDNVLNVIFKPVFDYLKWYLSVPEKSDYLFYGLEHRPECFDYDSLYKLSALLGDDRHDLKFVDLKSVMEYTVCAFCGRRHVKGASILELDDGRKMCRQCAENIVDRSKKNLKAYLDRARTFLESTYGIAFDDDYEFCFESTAKIVNMLNQNRNLRNRGADVPLMSYIDEKMKVHIECSIPPINLSELLVRELTHIWQLKRIPNLSEELAEGHIALVSVQYLKFLNQNPLVSARTTYYESNGNTSGEGYRKIVQLLLNNPQFNNNPFRYLLEKYKSSSNEILPPQLKISELGSFGLSYKPQQSDRVLNGRIRYFYYSRLNENAQKLYDQLLTAIMNHEKMVAVEGEACREIIKIRNAILYDHPELFWLKNIAISGQNVYLYYGATAEEKEILQKRMDEALPSYLEGIDDNMSAYDVAIRVHTKVISAVDYDTIALNKEKKAGGPDQNKIDFLRTICGVFIDKKAVCEGYARAVQYLLQKCGIECAEAVGYIRKENGEYSEAHAWNILKIDGDYYYLDTTWDDSSNTIQTVKRDDLGFDYFCITTDELTRTRDISLSPVDMPDCNAVRANYYYHNELVLDSYDLSKIEEIAKRAAKNNEKFFTFKCKTKQLYEQTLHQLCVSGKDCYDVLKGATKINKRISSSKYRYTYDRNIWTITIEFVMK